MPTQQVTQSSSNTNSTKKVWQMVSQIGISSSKLPTYLETTNIQKRAKQPRDRKQNVLPGTNLDILRIVLK